MNLSIVNEPKLQLWDPAENIKIQVYNRYLADWLKKSKEEKNKTSGISSSVELQATYAYESYPFIKDDYRILSKFYLRSTQYITIDYQEELIQQTNQKYTIDLSYEISELKNTIGDEFLKDPRPNQISYLLNSIKETLNLLQINSCNIVNQEEIVNFLEKNIEITILLREAVIEIPKIIKNKFSFRLELKEDPEINNLSTLFLFIVCKIKPNIAFKLLKKIDDYWYLRKVTDVNKFNINIEFI